jgi:hypothetical protein
MEIKDSGDRTLFESGAVRDMHGEDKGACELLPMDTIADYLSLSTNGKEYIFVFDYLHEFKSTGNWMDLLIILGKFSEIRWGESKTMLLELSKHFRDGCEKYGPDNWRLGIPVQRYLDSAVRHFLKHWRGDTDEPHDRAFCWNLICAAWTCKHKPELNPYRSEEAE